MAGILFHLTLVGCAGDGMETGPGATPETGAETAAEATSSDHPKEPEADTAAIAPDQPDRPKAAPPPDLMGKQRTEIIDILGRPVFSRRDKPALLLRYRQEGCILDLFLYPKSGGGAADQAVEHIEARTIAGQKMAPKGCIAAVIEARTAKQQS